MGQHIQKYFTIKKINKKYLSKLQEEEEVFKVFESLVPAISGVDVTKVLIMLATGLSFKIPLEKIK